MLEKIVDRLDEWRETAGGKAERTSLLGDLLRIQHPERRTFWISGKETVISRSVGAAARGI
jgi:hypothetical protein